MKNLFDFKHFGIIDGQIGKLTPCIVHRPFFTHGQWSMHETLLYLLSVTGPAHVTISSFSLSDITVQVFAKAIKEGYINKLDLLLHYSIKRNRLDLLLFAGNVVNKIHLAHTHMKLIMLENENWKIIVNQSANSTVNPAWESGVISTDEEIFKLYKSYINKAFSDSHAVEQRTVRQN